VAAIQASIRRGFLRSLYNQSIAQAASLQEALQGYQDSLFAGVKSGRILVNSSGTGSSVSFEIPSTLRGFTQDEVFGFSEELIQIYEDTVAALTAASADGSDPSIFAAMMADDRMQAVTKVHDSFTLIGLANNHA
jgi:hypothetical protein